MPRYYLSIIFICFFLCVSCFLLLTEMDSTNSIYDTFPTVSNVAHISPESDDILRKIFTNDLLALSPRKFAHGGDGLAEVVLTGDNALYKGMLKAKRYDKEYMAYIVDRTLGFYRVPFISPRNITVLNSVVQDCHHTCQWKNIGTGEMRNSTDGVFPTILMQYIDGMQTMEIKYFSSCFDEEGLYNPDGIFIYSIKQDMETGDVHKINYRRCELDLVMELSDLAIFDFLILNHDRWKTELLRNTFSSTLYQDRLVYIDNGNSFSRSKASPNHLNFCAFRDSTVARLVNITKNEKKLSAATMLNQQLLSPTQSTKSLKKYFGIVDEQLKKFSDHLTSCLAKFPTNKVLL